jgi:DNA polymerase III alpha subunit
MKTDQYGQIVLDENDVCDLIRQGRDLTEMRRIVVDDTVDIENMVHQVENVPDLVVHTFVDGTDMSVPDYDELAQRNWRMPEEYRQVDIAAHILELCETDVELQRVGEELLLYQERNMFDLLRYLKYLVDTMRENHVIWGVGRGSSVASYVLFLLGVHRVNSMHYDLDPREFLR